MILKETVVIPSLSDEERRIYIYLPTEYNKRNKKRYPVIYMFDGHNVFFDEDATYGKSWGFGKYLDYTDTPVIIAAIECSHLPNARLSEYSPYSFSDRSFGDIEGRGDETMRWFVEEFKPYVDHKYKTKPDRENTYICGSSMGGLMALYATIKYNDVFGKAISLSPSIWVDKKRLLADLKEANVKSDTMIYMDYGSKEIFNHKGMKQALGKLTGELILKNINVMTRIVRGGTHSEASWEKQIPIFMKCMGF